MVERRISRRQLLERIAHGRARRPRSLRSSPPARARPPRAASAQRARRLGVGRTVEHPLGIAVGRPTPVPTPEAELFIYNWTDYLAADVIKSFEVKYKTKVTQSFFSNTEERPTRSSATTAAATTSASRSRSTSRHSSSKGAIVKLDKSLLPNIVNLGKEWSDPGYDPGNNYTRAVHVVDDRRRLRHEQDQGRSSRARRRSGIRAGGSTSRCSTTARRSSG